MRMELRTVTPQLAADILSRNENNRRLSPDRVAQLAAEIRARRWKLNGESVIISTTGRLLDGQHRMAAVLSAQTAVPMLFVLDVEEDAVNTIDTGRGRSTADILRMNGISDGTALSASASILWRMLQGATPVMPAPANYIISVLERYPSIHDWVRKWNATGSIRRVISVSALVPGLVYLSDIAGRPDLAERLFTGLATGAGLNEGDPILALRNRVMNLRGGGTHLSHRMVWPLVSRTVEALEQGETLRRVLLDNNMAGPISVPRRLATHKANMTPEKRLDDLIAATSSAGVSAGRRKEVLPLSRVSPKTRALVDAALAQA